MVIIYAVNDERNIILAERSARANEGDTSMRPRRAHPAIADQNEYIYRGLINIYIFRTHIVECKWVLVECSII